MTIQTNDQTGSTDVVTKKAVRVARKPAVKRFEPLPDPDNKLPRPDQQESLANLFQTFSAKDQAVIASFVGSPEFMAPGYGRSARWLKAFLRAAPKAVKLG